MFGWFRRSWDGQLGPTARPFVLVYAYLLGECTDVVRLGRFVRPTLAHRIFVPIVSRKSAKG
ncbi:hypothetical protein [Streptomyces sp. MS2.AVA.5]|uniref:Uncharacterized protein n=1 Tax=Streptomyces achmelvichensis TaxID=3134111 RepID=A0ACC6Q8E3_9ACTN